MKKKFVYGGPTDSTAPIDWLNAGEYANIDLKAARVTPLSKYEREFIDNNSIEDWSSPLSALEKGLGYSKSNLPKKTTAAYKKAQNNYVAKRLLEDNPKGDMSRPDWLNRLTPMGIKAIENSNSKAKIKPNLWARTENAIFGSMPHGNANFKNASTTDEEFRSANTTDLLAPLQILPNTVNAVIKGKGVKDAVTGQPSNMSGAKEMILDPTTYIGTGLGIKGLKSLSKAEVKAIPKISLNNISKSDILDTFKAEVDWAKWNKEIPENKALLEEYHKIENVSKQSGNWMKNSDGSTFKGTPEQFVQQNSKNFKKAFGNSKLVNPDGSPTIQYHGSAKNFDTFDESKFQLGDSGYSGRGIYTTPDKTKASSYALSSKSIHTGEYEPTVYELYGQGNNPISAEDLIKQNKDYDLFNFHRAKNWQGDVPLEQQMLDYDVAIRNQTRGVERISPWNEASELVFPTNKQLKSAKGNNGMFDMTNPNIYKGLTLPATGVGAYYLEQLNKPKQKTYKSGGWLDNE